MTTGTLSELRNTGEVQTTIKTPVVDPVETPPTIDKEPITIRQRVVEVPQSSPSKEPEAPKVVKEDHCRFCMAHTIANLSLRFALVILVLAFSFNLLKSSKQ